MESFGRKLNIAVVMGGTSSEHDISLQTGTTIINALDNSKYQIKPIMIAKSGHWLFPMGFVKGGAFGLKEQFGSESNSEVKVLKPNLALELAETEQIDVVLIALHGKNGEDGTIQGMFELIGIPYTGSGVLASALAMNKVKTNDLFTFHGLDVPDYTSYSKHDFEQSTQRIIDEISKRFGYPCVIKPVDGGSSDGTYIVQDESFLEELLQKGFVITEEMMIQKFAKGDEVTCSVLDTDSAPMALPPTQIIPLSSSFFDREAKYTPGASEEVTPPRLPENTIRKIQDISLKAHKILGCSGVSRTDLIISDEKFYVLETNTLPGMTQTSLLPQAALHAGISFQSLLDMLIFHGLNRHKSSNRV